MGRQIVDAPGVPKRPEDDEARNLVIDLRHQNFLKRRVRARRKARRELRRAGSKAAASMPWMHARSTARAGLIVA
jgi:hypothetical protein